MDVMELRRALLQPHIKTIGGLPVIFDNAAYDNRNGAINSYIIDDHFFITGIFDTGSSASKSYTFTRYAPTLSTDRPAAAFRLYNDLASTSYDYWSISNSDGGTRTLSTAGRYILFPVYKPIAADMYMFDNTNNRYVFKGKNVT